MKRISLFIIVLFVAQLFSQTMTYNNLFNVSPPGLSGSDTLHFELALNNGDMWATARDYNGITWANELWYYDSSAQNWKSFDSSDLNGGLTANAKYINFYPNPEYRSFWMVLRQTSGGDGIWIHQWDSTNQNFRLHDYIEGALISTRRIQPVDDTLYFIIEDVNSYLYRTTSDSFEVISPNISLGLNDLFKATKTGIWYNNEEELYFYDFATSSISYIRDIPYYNFHTLNDHLSITSNNKIFYKNGSYFYLDNDRVLLHGIYGNIRNYFIGNQNDMWIYTDDYLIKIDSDTRDSVIYSMPHVSPLTTNYATSFINNETIYAYYKDASNKLSIERLNINHQPIFTNCKIMDSVYYVDAQSKRIIYTCTLNVVDDNQNDTTPLYRRTGGPSWFLTTEETTNNIINIDVSSVAEGDYNVSVLVRDYPGSFSTNNLDWTITVYSTSIEISETITSSATEDQIFRDTINLTDINDDSVYVVESTLPSWLSLQRIAAKSFKVEGQFDTNETDGSVNIIFSDSTNKTEPVNNTPIAISYDTVDVNITIINVNDLPNFTSSPVLNGTENQLYTYDANANDEEDGTNLTYSLDTYPTGMTINSSTGEITWTPNYDDNGDHSVIIEVVDQNSGTKQQSYTLNVSNTNRKPEILNSDTTIVLLNGDSTNYSVIASDPEGTTLIYTNSSYNEIVDLTNGNYKIRSKVAGSEDVYFFVSDGSLKDTVKVTITVTNDKPVVTNNDTSITIIFSDSVMYTVNAADPNNDDLTYSSSPYNTITNVANIYKIKPQTIGYDTVYLIVSDGVLKDSVRLILSVINVAPIVLNNDTTFDMNIGDSIIFTVNATDANGDNLTYSNSPFNSVTINGSIYVIKPMNSGIDTVHLVASDGILNDSVRIITVVNGKPTITNTDSIVYYVPTGNILNVTLHAVDLDAKGLTYTHTQYDSIFVVDSIFTIIPKAQGIETIHLIVSDGYFSDSIVIIIDATVVGIVTGPNIPKANFVSQNFPNPFNSVTSIRYGLCKRTDVSIEIFNMNGRMIKQLVNMNQKAGYHVVKWDTSENSSGTYIYHIRIGNKFSQIKRMFLVK